MTAWTVVRNEPAGIDVRWLRFDRPAEDYTTPGQYVLVTVAGHAPAFFAIASSPGEPLELLVKQIGPVALSVAASETDDTLMISPAQGEGFAIPHDNRALVLLANGTGLGALRPVIEREIAMGVPRAVHLYYGVFTAEHRSFLADLEAWGNMGVAVHTVVARPLHTSWTGATGFVQDVASSHGMVRNDTVVVAAGVPAMVDDARRLWEAVGAPVLTNF